MDLNENIAELNQILDTYETEMGFKITDVHNDEAKKIMNMSRAELQKLTPEMCAENSFILCGYVAFIQKCINKETTINKWAETKLKYCVVKRISNYRGSFDQQERQAALDDEYTKKLIKLVVDTQLRIDRMSYITGSINRMADRLKDLQVAKQNKGRE